MQTVIEEELSIGEESRDALQEWVDDPDALDEDKLIDLIERIGKGRFAQALASHVSEDTCPDYIRRALEHIRDAVA
jgi:putative ATP-dependent endonuclease of the OLD family